MKHFNKYIKYMAALVPITCLLAVTLPTQATEDDAILTNNTPVTLGGGDEITVFETKVDLTVNIDGEFSGEYSDTYLFDSDIDITAPETSSGKSFSYWEAEGNILSYNRNIKLSLTANTTLNAVYGKTVSESDRSAPTVGFISVNKDDDNNILFNAMTTADTVTEVGIYYSTDADTKDALISGGTKEIGTADRNNCWTLILKPKNENEVYYAIPYVTDGTTTYYGTVKKVKLLSLDYATSSSLDFDEIEGFDFGGIKLSDVDIAQVTEAPTGKSLTYNGNDLPLVTAGTADGGTVQYKLGEDGTYSKNIPTAKNAGTYKVYYKVFGDNNHLNSPENSVDVTIAKADPTVNIPTANKLVYNGTAQELVKEGSLSDIAAGNNVKLEYRLFMTEEIAEIKNTLSTEQKTLASANATPEQKVAALANVRETLTEYDDDTKWAEKVPTATAVGKYVVCYRVSGNENYNNLFKYSDYTDEQITQVVAAYDDDFFSNAILAGIDYNTAKITISDGIIVDSEGAEVSKTDGVYNINCGNTYVIYSDKSLTPSVKTGLKFGTETDETYGEKTYNYKYTVHFADYIVDGTKYVFAHKHATKSFSTDDTHHDTDKVWVYCEDEGMTSDDAKQLVYLDTDGTYYYGDAPTDEDIILNEYFGAVPTIQNFYFTKKGDASGTKVSPKNMEIGATYIVNATISVNIDNKISNYAISKEIIYAAKPLSMCDIYLVNGKNETKLDVVDGKITVPADTFTYNKEEQAPVIVVKNNVLGTAAVLTETDYTDGIEAKTDAGSYTAQLMAAEGGNYTGSLTVNWSIAKASADVQAVAKEGIVYDGQKLDMTDFAFTDEQGVLTSADAEITITGSDITNVGERTAIITVTSKNYNDIVLNVPATIAKRTVTFTPDADQKSTFGDTEIAAITFTIEEQNDTAKTGFVTSDLAEGQTSAGFFGDVVIVGTEQETTNILKPENDNVFDYDTYANDAGTYSYTFTEAAFPNYDLVIADGAFYKVERKNIASDDITVTLTDTEFTYDNTIHKTDVDSIMFGDTKLVKDTDYSIGGTTQKFYPGEFNVQVAGEGNYIGIAYAGWKVRSAEGGASISTVNGGVKTYDGNDVSDLFAVDTGIIPRSKATISTAYYEKKEDGTQEEIVVGVPKNAGNYVVEVKIDAKGYTSQTLKADLTVEQKTVTVNGTLDKTIIIYGEDTPTVVRTSFDGILDAELAEFEANTTVEWTLDAEQKLFTAVVNTVYSNNYSFNIVSPTYSIAAKDIESTDVIVYYTPKVKLSKTGWTTCNDIVVIDKKTNQKLTEGVDYLVNNNTSMSIGEFTIEIIGIGNNYEGVKELPWDVVETEEQAAFSMIANYKTYDDNGRITFTISNSYNGNKKAAYGVLIYRDKEQIELTLEAAETNTDILSKEFANFNTATFRTLDLGNGVTVRPYMIIDGECVYGDQVYVNYNELKAKEAIEKAHSEITSHTKQDNNGRIRFSANFSYNGDEDVTYGVLIHQRDTEGKELTFDTADFNKISEWSAVTFASKDIGNGITIRTYMCIGGEYIYGDQITYYYSDFT